MCNRADGCIWVGHQVDKPTGREEEIMKQKHRLYFVLTAFNRDVSQEEFRQAAIDVMSFVANTDRGAMFALGGITGRYLLICALIDVAKVEFVQSKTMRFGRAVHDVCDCEVSVVPPTAKNPQHQPVIARILGANQELFKIWYLIDLQQMIGEWYSF